MQGVALPQALVERNRYYLIFKIIMMKTILRWFSRTFWRPVMHADPGADRCFFNLGVQYYVVARFSAIAELLFVSGNQYHLAVEMLLKGQLAKTICLESLKRKYSHRLKRTWKDFKKLFPAENLSSFDDLICELARFERIRYPDNVLREGMTAILSWEPQTTTTTIKGPKVPQYEIAVTELDELIGTLFRLCSINSAYYMCRLNEHAMKVVKKDNSACIGWFPGGENK